MQLETQLQNYNTSLNYYNSTMAGGSGVPWVGRRQVRNDKLNESELRESSTCNREIAAMTEQLTHEPSQRKGSASHLASLEKSTKDEARKRRQTWLSRRPPPAIRPCRYKIPSGP